MIVTMRFSMPSGMNENQLMQDVVVDLGEDVLEILDEARAKDRPDQGAGAAQDGHQNNLARRGPLHPLAPASGSIAASRPPARPAYMPEITKGASV